MSVPPKLHFYIDICTLIVKPRKDGCYEIISGHRRKFAAENMDEMVKVVKVYAANPANELAADTYTITITHDAGTTVSKNCPEGLTAELDASIPKWNTTTTKSKKWGVDGKATNIAAMVTVNSEGGTSVTYTTGDAEGTEAKNNKFAQYMSSGEAKAKK